MLFFYANNGKEIVRATSATGQSPAIAKLNRAKRKSGEGIRFDKRGILCQSNLSLNNLTENINTNTGQRNTARATVTLPKPIGELGLTKL